MARRSVFMILKLTTPASGEPMAMSTMLSKVTDVVILNQCNVDVSRLYRSEVILQNSEDVACMSQ